MALAIRKRGPSQDTAQASNIPSFRSVRITPKPKSPSSNRVIVSSASVRIRIIGPVHSPSPRFTVKLPPKEFAICLTPIQTQRILPRQREFDYEPEPTQKLPQLDFKSFVWKKLPHNPEAYKGDKAKEIAKMQPKRSLMELVKVEVPNKVTDENFEKLMLIYLNNQSYYLENPEPIKIRQLERWFRRFPQSSQVSSRSELRIFLENV